MATRKAKVLGYNVVNTSLGDCVGDIARSICEHGDRHWLACLNPHSYVVANSDSEFMAALRSADYLLPDGVGIKLAGWVRGVKLTRITGFDLFFRLSSELSNAGGLSVFYLGSSESVLRSIRKRHILDFPALKVVGMLAPPFKDTYSQDEQGCIIKSINDANPDVLWVAMTAPKQEKWIYSSLSYTNVKFAAAIGAVFDYYAGSVRRPSPVFRRLGLEWLPRLMQQPRRLWRRTFVSTPCFLLAVGSDLAKWVLAKCMFRRMAK